MQVKKAASFLEIIFERRRISKKYALCTPDKFELFKFRLLRMLILWEVDAS